MQYASYVRNSSYCCSDALVRYETWRLWCWSLLLLPCRSRD